VNSALGRQSSGPGFTRDTLAPSFACSRFKHMRNRKVVPSGVLRIARAGAHDANHIIAGFHIQMSWSRVHDIAATNYQNFVSTSCSYTARSRRKGQAVGRIRAYLRAFGINMWARRPSRGTRHPPVGPYYPREAGPWRLRPASPARRGVGRIQLAWSGLRRSTPARGAGRGRPVRTACVCFENSRPFAQEAPVHSSGRL